jgi:hypothetical protein
MAGVWISLRNFSPPSAPEPGKWQGIFGAIWPVRRREGLHHVTAHAGAGVGFVPAAIGKRTRVARLFLWPGGVPRSRVLRGSPPGSDRLVGELGPLGQLVDPRSPRVSGSGRSPCGRGGRRRIPSAPGGLHVLHDPVAAGPSRAGRAESFDGIKVDNPWPARRRLTVPDQSADVCADA